MTETRTTRLHIRTGRDVDGDPLMIALTSDQIQHTMIEDEWSTYNGDRVFQEVVYDVVHALPPEMVDIDAQDPVANLTLPEPPAVATPTLTPTT
jgi:hypothetical protein